MSAIQETIDYVKEDGEFSDCKEQIELAESAQSEFDALNNYIKQLGVLMPCGHLARYAVNEEDGTQYCCMCDRNAQMIVLEKTLDILDKTATCVQLLREVDDRVPGLLYDHYDENMVSLGVRINNAIIELDKVNNQ